MATLPPNSAAKKHGVGGNIPRPRISLGSGLSLAIWLAAQLTAIAVCAKRVALFNHAPAETEKIALAMLAGVQVGVSSLLFPTLLETSASAILAVASCWPLAQLAAQLSDVPLWAPVRTEAYVCLWLISLHLIARRLRTPSQKLLAATIAATITLGEPIVWYLQMEFSNSAKGDSWFGIDFLRTAILQAGVPLSAGKWLALWVLFLIAVLPVKMTKRR
jgi:hypothetical protein